MGKAPKRCGEKKRVNRTGASYSPKRFFFRIRSFLVSSQRVSLCHATETYLLEVGD
jgi:hypothetical protein